MRRRQPSTSSTRSARRSPRSPPPRTSRPGPFVITRVNPGSAVLDRNPHFFAADRIGPKQVVVRNYTGNDQIWSYMTNGELDAAPVTAIPDNVLQRILKAGNQRVDAINYVDAALAFNQSVAPFDKVEVRQALAHVIDREAVTKVGQPAGGTASKATTGLIDKVAEKWLTSEQQAALDPLPARRGQGRRTPPAGRAHQEGRRLASARRHGRGNPSRCRPSTASATGSPAAPIVANQTDAFGISDQDRADRRLQHLQEGDGGRAVSGRLLADGPGPRHRRGLSSASTARTTAFTRDRRDRHPQVRPGLGQLGSTPRPPSPSTAPPSTPVS
ncbi:ABC transporter substrate-binding protein [Streptomyces sp. TLI_171]|uniref:ABC transporter substrate-binding protein n=1 Tax=Streptomyces sp. TLI_171 TaxID=1938859 RepID=UPI000E712DD3|nr:ABC transporter substrate-binding protein [Streptomyces sp. TLI_171]